MPYCAGCKTYQDETVGLTQKDKPDVNVCLKCLSVKIEEAKHK